MRMAVAVVSDPAILASCEHVNEGEESLARGCHPHLQDGLHLRFRFGETVFEKGAQHIPLLLRTPMGHHRLREAVVTH